MTVTLDDIELPDLEKKLACEYDSPDHSGGGCLQEAAVPVVLLCGHCHELLRGPCTQMYVEGIESGCPDCGGPLSCRVCEAAVDRLVVRPK